MGRNLDEMSVQALLERYVANRDRANELGRQADVLFFEGIAVPWWRPGKAARLLDAAAGLRREALRLYEENVELGIVIERRTAA